MPPAAPMDATTSVPITSSSVFMIGDTITYTCNNPAFRINDDVVRCQADGTWIPEVVESCMQVGKLKTFKNGNWLSIRYNFN